ncbi:unnamed protein product [Trichogramma brassicae]|uniref:Uncharacterized protein n=1 Tax=Trichogramma brassicae TaxID=86971 RepID=A0A6H5IVE1_9HYME|nr:unnamed protein product [Trichogramma brassicae]
MRASAPAETVINDSGMTLYNNRQLLRASPHHRAIDAIYSPSEATDRARNGRNTRELSFGENTIAFASISRCKICAILERLSGRTSWIDCQGAHTQY